MGRAIDVIDELEKFTSRSAAVLTRRMVRNLVAATPKKTGWAASNWLPSLGGTLRGPVGSKQAVTFGPQIAGMGEVSNYRITRTYPPVIVNDVPYIEILNYGSSIQAPPLFIESAIQQAIFESSGVTAR